MQMAAGKDKIRLAFFGPKYIRITFVEELVLGLDKDRFDVIFIYLSGYGVDGNLLEEAGYKFFYLSNIKRINAFRPSILVRLVRILKEIPAIAVLRYLFRLFRIRSSSLMVFRRSLPTSRYSLIRERERSIVLPNRFVRERRISPTPEIRAIGAILDCKN